MIKGLGEFITRGLWHASLCAFIFALLPFFGWVATVIVALICLCKGPAEGFLVLLWACLPSIAMAVAGWHGSALQAGYFATTCVLVWLMAWLLWRTSWATMLSITAGLGVITVVALHGVYPELITQLQNYVSTALSQMDITVPDQQQFVTQWSQSVVRFMVVSVLAFSCSWVVFARSWQAMLFHPGRLREELHNIRLNKWLAVVAIGIAALTVALPTEWLMDILPVIMLPFSIAGLSLVHSFVAAKKINVAWLVGFYVIAVLALGIVAIGLAIAALADSWLDLRKRWQ